LLGYNLQVRKLVEDNFLICRDNRFIRWTLRVLLLRNWTSCYNDRFLSCFERISSRRLGRLASHKAREEHCIAFAQSFLQLGQNNKELVSGQEFVF